ncbi:MAG: hypothetical protein DRR16_33405 [Candidatus Parabeggiatoa sp. nov. 3]|nr:MAG: hypothetical protein DRR00_00280 [Gammaproteobacteria bacterium]RKZ69406.1 MAG: hypothetical protein DRQ99_01170 [Gammaproteobacteria bacterium]RKZ73087.1 MAG: hypothetical protein DRR16_33405 [Gammaproteobacteria bacterium]
MSRRPAKLNVHFYSFVQKTVHKFIFIIVFLAFFGQLGQLKLHFTFHALCTAKRNFISLKKLRATLFRFADLRFTLKYSEAKLEREM